MLTTGARNWSYFHSEHRQIERLRRMHPDPIVQVHPDKLAELGMEDGEWVWIENQNGRAKIKIAPGTHAGKVLRLGGKGLPDVNGYGRGDELVVVDITIPSKLSAEEKRLVEQLAQQPGFQHAESVKNQNIFERMKSFFR